MTIADIQAQFPHPCRARPGPAHELGAYCVGGALCLSAGARWRWPEPWQLRQALRRLNPALREASASWYARRIIKANDRAEFATAWRLATAALARTDTDATQKERAHA